MEVRSTNLKLADAELLDFESQVQRVFNLVMAPDDDFAWSTLQKNERRSKHRTEADHLLIANCRLPIAFTFELQASR